MRQIGLPPRVIVQALRVGSLVVSVVAVLRATFCAGAFCGGTGIVAWGPVLAVRLARLRASGESRRPAP